MSPPEAFPNVYRLDTDAKTVTETDDYRILDIHYENDLGWCYWTTVDVVLKPDRHSYYFQFSVHMHYTVTDGEAWFLIGTQGRALHRGDMIAVPAGKHHMILNKRDNKDANYTIQVPARLNLREYIGSSFPEPKEEKKVSPQHAGGTPPPQVGIGQPIAFPPGPFVPGGKTTP